MQILKEKEKKTISPAASVTVHEYDTADTAISGVIAEIRGRYPEKGYAVNRRVKELVYVLSGHGKILTPEGEKEIAVGDVILIAPSEKFAWLGDMKIHIATAPKFDPAQYEYCE
jgi:mannose-6-phosphate isomerase-like protein (cupin superfamily)